MWPQIQLWGDDYLLVVCKYSKFEGYGTIWDDLDKSGLMRSALGPMRSALPIHSASSKLHCNSASDAQRTASNAQRQAKLPWKTRFLSPWLPNRDFYSPRVFLHNEMIKRTSFTLNMNDFKNFTHLKPTFLMSKSLLILNSVFPLKLTFLNHLINLYIDACVFACIGWSFARWARAVALNLLHIEKNWNYIKF